MYNSISVINKKIKFEFEKIESYNAGIVLSGSEVKSIRLSNFNLKDSYCKFINNELYTNFNISEYKNNFLINKHIIDRPKKLLLTKKELKELQELITTKRYTIVPFRLFTNEQNLIKIELWLAKGKNLYDKRQSIKKNDLDRENKFI